MIPSCQDTFSELMRCIAMLCFRVEASARYTALAKVSPDTCILLLGRRSSENN